MNLIKSNIAKVKMAQMIVIPIPGMRRDLAGVQFPAGGAQGQLSPKRTKWPRTMSMMSVAGMIFKTMDAGEMQYTNMRIPTIAKTMNGINPPPLPRGPIPIFSGGFSFPIKFTSFYPTHTSVLKV
jgi:hypothetical protein